MIEDTTPEIYRDLGIKRVINTLGTATIMGGSVISPGVQAAMEQANGAFASMHQVLEKAGEAIADALGVEAAFVTSGCFAALALSSAAIMAGTDRESIARLPDTTGLKNEFLIQSRMRYEYDRCVSVVGGRLIEVGDDQGTTANQMDEAIGSGTAGILYVAHLEGTDGTLSLSEVIGIAKERNVSVLVDAAYQVYPLDRMTGLAQSGADSVCFSAKYMGGPNSVGFLCGRKEFVEAASLHGFTSFELEQNRAFGRGYKVDRQEVVALVVVLREWFALDHQERNRVQEQRFQVIAEALGDLPNVRVEQGWHDRLPWMVLKVILDQAALGKTAAQVADQLRESDPSIWLRVEGDTIPLAVNTLAEGEEHLVARMLREALKR